MADPNVDLDKLDPAQGADQAKATPKTVEIALGDAKFTVDPAVAEAIKTAQEAARAAGEKASETESRLNAQLAELQAQLKPAPAADDAEGDDIDTLLFTDPKRAADLIVQRATEQVRAEINTTRAQDQFWVAFYEANPELKEDDLVVKAVLQRDRASLNPLTVEKAIEKLGESTKRYLLDRGIDRKKPEKQRGAEGGTHKGPAASKKDDVSESSPLAGGLTAVLKERAKARRAARSPQEATT